MNDEPPAILSYAKLGSHAWSFEPFVGVAIFLSFLFLVAANVVETETSNYLVRHDGAFGPWSLDAQTRSTFGWNQSTDLTIEFFWSVMAATVYFAATIAIGPRRGWRIRWPVVATGLLGAVAYSWVRWVPHFLNREVGEGADFLLAMALAASGGLATGIARRIAGSAASRGRAAR